jgi:hypothetical protein
LPDGKALYGAALPAAARAPRVATPPRRRGAPLQRLHFNPASQCQIAGYRIGKDQSRGGGRPFIFRRAGVPPRAGDLARDAIARPAAVGPCVKHPAAAENEQLDDDHGQEELASEKRKPGGTNVFPRLSSLGEIVTRAILQHRHPECCHPLATVADILMSAGRKTRTYAVVSLIGGALGSDTNAVLAPRTVKTAEAFERFDVARET